jgi:predicted dehydrogenase
MKVAVLGFGLIGKERVQGLQDLRASGCPIEIIGVHDPFLGKESTGQDREDLVWLDSLGDVESLAPDWIIVSTPHDVAVPLVERLLPLQCRILMEKPFGRSLQDAELLFRQLRFPDQLFVGFDYRFYPGIAQAIHDARTGVFGDIASVTMVLGHGGAPGMENSWKFDPVRAGGGALIDPGIHLLDVSHLLSPKGVSPLKAWSWSGFWNTGIEEEVHLLLQADGFVINMQVSVVRWRSTFRLEIQGTQGYGFVKGRNRSYGAQTYVRGKRWGWRGGGSQAVSEEQVLTSEGKDTFHDELASLLQPGRSSFLLPPCAADQALTVMKTYDRCAAMLNLR